MKENSSPCENAAVRVQHWFGKDKENLLRIKNHLPKTQEFCKRHKCDLVKTPRIPSQVEHLPLQGYVLSKKKRQTKQRHVTKGNLSKHLRFAIDKAHCNVNQKYPVHLLQENPLTAARVAQVCQFKGHFLVSKRLKHISKQKSAGPKRHEVVPIKSSSQNDLSKNPYLQEWAKIKEERQFQIGRVIKYLAD